RSHAGRRRHQERARWRVRRKASRSIVLQGRSTGSPFAFGGDHRKRVSSTLQARYGLPHAHNRERASMSRTQWLLLVVLSVLWGGSFFFVGVAVKELPAFTIVLAR